MRSFVQVGFSMVVAVVASACGSDTVGTGCTTDLDCRGDRICENEACIVAPDEVFTGVDNSDPGDNNGATGGCDTDNPCSGDTLCEGGQCRTVCGEDTDCETGELCEHRMDGPGDVCMPGLSCLPDELNEDDRCTSTWTCNDGTTRAVRCETNARGIARCSCFDSSEHVLDFVWDERAACRTPSVTQLAHNICGFQAVDPW